MIHIQENIPLAPMTTFEIGGMARYFVEVKNEESLREALLWARSKTIPIFILAGGSNLLVPDSGVEALVIKLVMENSSFTDTMLEAQAGCNLLQLIRAGAAAGLGGWEKLAGIPGTIGGAVRGNAGAFGPEMKDFLVSVRAINTNTFKFREFRNAECEFGYRMSYFKKHPEWIVLDVHIELRQIEPKESAKLIKATIAERERRHIQDVRAAGSYFMNPVVPDAVRDMFEEEKGVKSREGRVPAGWLIEKAGMKGMKKGEAAASVQHPNYLVNLGGASSSDVRALASEIKKKVKEKFGVELQEEAVIL